MKEWTYHNNYYLVKMYRCVECAFEFREYYHDGQLSHTIPKDAKLVKKRQKIISFLKKHNNVTTEAIALGLEMDVKEVLDTLHSLKVDGKIERVDEGKY